VANLIIIKNAYSMYEKKKKKKLLFCLVSLSNPFHGVTTAKTQVGFISHLRYHLLSFCPTQPHHHPPHHRFRPPTTSATTISLATAIDLFSFSFNLFLIVFFNYFSFLFFFHWCYIPVLLFEFFIS